MTIEVAASEIKDRIEELLARVEAGDTVVVTRGERVVAEMKSRAEIAKDKDAGQPPEAGRAAIDRVRALRDSGLIKSVTLEERLAWRDEGRRG